MSLVTSKIEQALEAGFCLHGSNVMGQKVIHPRQAWCATGLPERNLLAVYADFDLRRPLLHAIMHHLCGVEPTWMFYEDFNYPLTVVGGNIGFGYSSIYALPTETFVLQGKEFVSAVPVQVAIEFVVGKRVFEEFQHFYEIKFPVVF